MTKWISTLVLLFLIVLILLTGVSVYKNHITQEKVSNFDFKMKATEKVLDSLEYENRLILKRVVDINFTLNKLKNLELKKSDSIKIIKINTNEKLKSINNLSIDSTYSLWTGYSRRK